MSNLKIINDAEQSALVSNSRAKNGEMYLKATGSTNEGDVVIYYNGSWIRFDNEASAAAFENRWGANFSTAFLQTGSDPGLTVKSVSFWFKQTISQFAMIVSGLGGPAYTTYGGFGTGLNGSLRWNDGFYGGKSADNTFSYNTWNHVAFFHVPSGYVDTLGSTTSNGAGWAIYLNNIRVDIEESVSTYGTTPVTTTNKFAIGKEGERASTYEFSGELDEVALFTSSISASDVSDIYNGGVPVDLGAGGLNLSPDIYYRMGDDSNDSPSAGGNISSISDSSGNGHHLSQSTASDQPTFSDLTGETIYA